MIRCVLLVALVSASAFGLNGDDDMDLGQDPVHQARNMCYFGHPSSQCQRKCREEQQGAEPVCKEASGLCVCRPKEQQEPEHQDVSTLHNMGNQQLAQTTAEPGHEEMVIPMKDYCFFGEYPSLACKSKCAHQRLDAFCQEDSANKTCGCREKQQQTQAVAEMPNMGTPDIADYCWFGQFPSSACRTKCGEHQPTCSQRHCVCLNQVDILTINPLAPVTTDLPETAEEEEEAEPTESSTLQHIVFFLGDFGGFLGNGTKTANETEGQTTSETPTLESPTSAPKLTLAPDQGQQSFWTLPVFIGIGIGSLLGIVVCFHLHNWLSKRRAKKNIGSVFNQVSPNPSIQTKPVKN